LDKRLADATLICRRKELAHCWTTGVTGPNAATSYEQTQSIFERYDALLRAQNMTLAGDVVRTWLFVQSIDANYEGVVAARREFFESRGLTPDTHFIASTGIEGTGVDPTAQVGLDAYAIGGLRSEQIAFLAAPEFLGPPHAYGVTFERGTTVAYRDRRHVIISGTASIDPEGRILHAGDVSRQLDRALENFEALLRRAGAMLQDVCVFIAYVRQPGDLAAVRRQLKTRCGAAPIEVVVAPICRPGWLVEIEGQAIVHAVRPDLPGF
jgi:enamine deaminase RidA (YjgF/YER057c/UK114 family)